MRVPKDFPTSIKSSSPPTGHKIMAMKRVGIGNCRTKSEKKSRSILKELIASLNLISFLLTCCSLSNTTALANRTKTSVPFLLLYPPRTNISVDSAWSENGRNGWSPPSSSTFSVEKNLTRLESVPLRLLSPLPGGVSHTSTYSNTEIVALG